MSEQTLTSRDGTTIAYEVDGSGPAVIVVNTVAEDRTSAPGIIGLLAQHFTVLSYDRRGRGGSGDPQPYDPAREIEDLAALVDVVGGRAALISGSAGGVLALDAASALGDAVIGLFLYEPPFIVDDARPPMPADYVAHVEGLVADGKRSEAVEYFMTEALQIPAEWVAGMKQDPSWDQMAALAHTYAYDGRILEGLQDGTPLPRDRWSIDAHRARARRREQRAVLRDRCERARRGAPPRHRRAAARPRPCRVLDGARRHRRRGRRVRRPLTAGRGLSATRTPTSPHASNHS